MEIRSQRKADISKRTRICLPLFNGFDTLWYYLFGSRDSEGGILGISPHSLSQKENQPRNIKLVRKIRYGIICPCPKNRRKPRKQKVILPLGEISSTMPK